MRTERVRFMLNLTAAGVLLLLSGCASMQSTQSGFLSNYDHLRADPKSKRDLTYANAAVNWPALRKAKIEAVELRLPERTAKKLGESERADLEKDLREILRSAFAAHFEITEQREPGTVCIRVAITDVDTVNTGLNAVMLVVAVPVDNGGVSVEMEGLDAETREQLFALSSYATGGVSEVKGFVTKLGHARSGFKRITQTALALMQRHDEGSPAKPHS